MPAELSTPNNALAPSSTSTTTTSPTMAPTRTLTLIVAATPSLGIGRGGTLPWPQLKQEMGYFSRITKRVPLSSSSSPSSADAPKGIINAVVMGRKTWESIPPKFRPLKGRVNVVISRSMPSSSSSSSSSALDGPVIATSMDSALSALESHAREQEYNIGDVFIIGGSSIYDAALKMPEAKRVLLTKIQRPEFECDTFFPVDLEGEEARGEGWRRKGWRELVGFASGESVVGGAGVVEDEGKAREGEVEWEYCLFERA